MENKTTVPIAGIALIRFSGDGSVPESIQCFVELGNGKKLQVATFVSDTHGTITISAQGINKLILESKK